MRRARRPFQVWGGSDWTVDATAAAAGHCSRNHGRQVWPLAAVIVNRGCVNQHHVYWGGTWNDGMFVVIQPKRRLGINWARSFFFFFVFFLEEEIVVQVQVVDVDCAVVVDLCFKALRRGCNTRHSSSTSLKEGKERERRGRRRRRRRRR